MFLLFVVAMGALNFVALRSMVVIVCARALIVVLLQLRPCLSCCALSTAVALLPCVLQLTLSCIVQGSLVRYHVKFSCCKHSLCSEAAAPSAT